MLKYNSSSNLEIISKIIANQGKSGYSYLENIEKVINLNKPTLMFYGIEQLSAFFRNLHFNFTDENTKYNSIKKRFLRHGIDAFDFKNIGTNISLGDLLNKEIRFKIEGFSPLFFLLNLADHHDISIDFFIEEKKISFSELLRNFFNLRNKNIPNLIRSKFEDNFGNDRPKIRLNSFILTIYLLSFLFSHISRYKMHTWLKLIENDEKNISFYVKYIIKKGHLFYIKSLFEKLFYNEMILGGTYHQLYL